MNDRPDLTPPDPGAPASADAAPSASEIFGAALGGAARRAGLDPSEGKSTGHVVWGAMGGWRGVLESVLPGLIFVAVYTVTIDPATGDGNLWLSLGLSVGIAAVFTIARLIARQPVTAAVGGLVAAGVAAAFAAFTGEANNNFIPGFITNVVYGSALLISALIGWSIIGLAVGFLMGEGTAWRRDKRKRRVFFWLTIAWASLFAARLIVQVPLYLADNVTALGTLKLVMGLPLFAPLVAVTWLVVRAVYPRSEATPDPAAE
ncbi:DUF3159 domain-containing protein [Microbacterium sp. NPDC055910]|uniref:DUF3159 domain-containing protein n=1 Tax=Microbacterium sp. NPDC055910 TaxID=3345659 RepID=UPI0035D7DD74